MKYLLQIKLSKVRTPPGISFNQFKVTGSNLNGSLGIGTEDDGSSKVYQLHQFNNKKVYSVAVGDFHTLAVASGCNCTDPIKDRCCLGQYECNSGADLYSWGFNMHGQCNGLPSDKPLLEPQIVPFFVGRKQVKLVAACRARSIAITTDNEVYEWGFTGSEGEQF